MSIEIDHRVLCNEENGTTILIEDSVDNNFYYAVKAFNHWYFLKYSSKDNPDCVGPYRFISDALLYMYEPTCYLFTDYIQKNNAYNYCIEAWNLNMEPTIVTDNSFDSMYTSMLPSSVRMSNITIAQTPQSSDSTDAMFYEHYHRAGSSATVTLPDGFTVAREGFSREEE